MHYLVIVGIETGELRAIAIDDPAEGEAAARAIVRCWRDEGRPFDSYAMKILARVEGGTVYHEGLALPNTDDTLESQLDSLISRGG
jgi:hypothetical protein